MDGGDGGGRVMGVSGGVMVGGCGKLGCCEVCGVVLGEGEGSGVIGVGILVGVVGCWWLVVGFGEWVVGVGGWGGGVWGLLGWGGLCVCGVVLLWWVWGWLGVGCFWCCGCWGCVGVVGGVVGGWWWWWCGVCGVGLVLIFRRFLGGIW